MGTFWSLPSVLGCPRVRGPPYRAIKAWPVLSHMRSCPQEGEMGLGQESGRVSHCPPLPPTLPRIFTSLTVNKNPRLLIAIGLEEEKRSQEGR